MTSTLSGMDPRRRAAVRDLLVAEVNATAARPAGLPSTFTEGPDEHRPAAAAARPRRPRPARRRIAVGLASAAAVSVLAAVMLAGDPTAPASYATWTAAPSPAPAAGNSEEDGTWDRVLGFFGVGGIQTQASQCEDLTGGSVGIEGVPRRERDAAQRSVLVDRRGDWTFCVDVIKGAGTANDPLIVMNGLKADKPIPEGIVASNNTTVWDKPYTWPAGASVSVLGGNPFAVPDVDAEKESYSLVGGAGPDVTGVDINLADGTIVTATVHEDYWAAWWPGTVTTARIDTLTISTTSGERYDVDPRTIDLPWEQYGASTTPWP